MVTRQEVEQLVCWFSQNHPELNLLKTVKMTVDLRRDPPPLSHLTILNRAFPTTWKLLGTTISRHLKWSIQKNTEQRLHFLRQLRKFDHRSHYLVWLGQRASQAQTASDSTEESSAYVCL